MDLFQFSLHQVHGRSSRRSINPVGNISITLNERFQKQYRSRNGRVIVLRDYTLSPKRFPVIQIPSDSVALPVCLSHALAALNINRMLTTFLIREISNMASYLSFGGSAGFHLFTEVEALGIEVVEGEGDEEHERLLRKETSRIIVEMLSRKQRGGTDNKGVIVREGDTCAVCLEELMGKTTKEEEEEEEEEVIPMPCHHNFHASCISRWLEEQNSCPMCRREIQYEDLVG